MPRVLAPLSSMLVDGVHRFAMCWQITRTDGVVLRLTDHNSALTIDGHIYTPTGAPAASAKEYKADSSPTNFNAKSFITSDAITHEDLVADRYRDADGVEFMVNWQYPWMGKFRVNLFKVIESTFTKEIWEWQIENSKTRFRQRVGRVFARDCDYIYGDPNTCKKVPISQAATIASVVSDLQQVMITTTPQADGFFDDGTVEWLTGANAGLTSEVKTYLNSGFVEFHVRTPFPIAAGDTLNIIDGCEHTSAACKDKGNLPNFGGFPTVPGNDRQFSTPTAT